MATFNEILVGRFGSLLTKAFQMVGTGNPAPQLEASIQPVAPIWPLPIEYDYLAEQYRFFGGSAATGGPAKQSYFSIANPANSGVIAVIDIINVSSDNSDTLTFAYATTSPPAANAPSRQADARSVRGSSLSLTAGVDAATDWPTRANIFTNFAPPTTAVFTLARSAGLFVLQPQNALVIVSSSAATTLRCFISWMERSQLASERTIR